MNGSRALIALLLLLFTLGCSERATGEHDEHVEEAPHESESSELVVIAPEMLGDLRLSTAAAERRLAGEGVSAVGELRPDQRRFAEVGVPITARIVALAVEPGDSVRPGQLLAQAQSVELGRARADYDSARARVELARAAVERKRSLADRIVPRREVEEAEATLAAAQAELRAAAAALEALGASPSGTGSRMALAAPLGGVVLERNAALGQMVDPSDVIFRIGDLSTLWLVANAFERDAVRVPVGSNARVTLAAFPGRPFSGRVTWVGRQVDPGSRTIPVRIELDNAEGLLRPGMSATAWLEVSGATAEVITVPQAALQRVHDEWVVFVPRGEGRFEIRSVERGRDLEADVEIVRGLAAGETVVVDGAFLLKAEAEKGEGGGDHHEH